jgi:elongator complex protein 4
MKGQLHSLSSLHPTANWPSAGAGKQLSRFKLFLNDLDAKLQNTPSSLIFRVVVPSILPPALYSPGACNPTEVLQFLHGLRALLRVYSQRLTALITLPISLFPRETGLTRWMELLCDGVLELIPLPRQTGVNPDTKKEDVIQGMMKVHSLPVYHERGGGLEGSFTRENLSFRLSSSNGLVIKPFSLPPVGEDEHNKSEEKKEEQKKKQSLEF